MRGLSSTVLSMSAMALSSLTTYLTFFDARYALTVATADVAVRMQTSGGRNGDGERTATYQYSPTFNMVLSNRGTRALVITEIELLKSQSADRCDVDDENLMFRYSSDGLFDTTIVEPGTVLPKVLEFGLDRIEAEAGPGQLLTPQPETALYCARYTVFDPNGRRHEPVAPALTVIRGFEQDPEPLDELPDGTLEVDYPKGATTLVNRGFF
ncbi:MAG: hypothetical protein AAF253_06305 [Pseudomonadota bacterium]